MASLGANRGRRAPDSKKEQDVNINNIVLKGVEAFAPYRWSVYSIFYQLSGGIKSGLSYNGPHSIAELQKKAQFIGVTNAGLKESGAHDVSQYVKNKPKITHKTTIYS